MVFEIFFIYIIVWLTVFILSLIMEAITSVYVSMWFSLSSLIMVMINLVLKYVKGLFNISFFPWYLQLFIFLFFSLIFIFAFRPVLVKKLASKFEKTNVDSIIGETGVVIKTIPQFGVGVVKIGGQEWSAIADVEIVNESIVKIKEIKGVKLFVVKE